MNCKNPIKHNLDFQAAFAKATTGIDAMISPSKPSFSLFERKQYRAKMLNYHPLRYSVMKDENVDNTVIRTLDEWATRIRNDEPREYYDTLKETALGFLLFGTEEEKDNMTEILSTWVNDIENPFGTFRLDKALREELSFVLDDPQISENTKVRFADCIMKRALIADYPAPNETGDENILKRLEIPNHIEMLALWVQKNPTSLVAKSFVYNLCAYYNDNDESKTNGGYKVEYKIETVRYRVLVAMSAVLQRTNDEQLKTMAFPVWNSINKLS